MRTARILYYYYIMTLCIIQDSGGLFGPRVRRMRKNIQRRSRTRRSPGLASSQQYIHTGDEGRRDLAAGSNNTAIIYDQQLNSSISGSRRSGLHACTHTSRDRQGCPRRGTSKLYRLHTRPGALLQRCSSELGDRKMVVIFRSHKSGAHINTGYYLYT